MRLRRRRVLNPPFARGISDSWLLGAVWKHGADLMLLRLVHESTVAQVALPFGRLLGQIVALVVAAGGFAKALLRAGIAFHFGHTTHLAIRAGMYTTRLASDQVFCGGRVATGRVTAGCPIPVLPRCGLGPMIMAIRRPSIMAIC